MKYLGIAKKEKGYVVMPDSFVKMYDDKNYHAIEIDDTILLMRSPLDKNCLAKIEKLTEQSIYEHRTALEGLAC